METRFLLSIPFVQVDSRDKLSLLKPLLRSQGYALVMDEIGNPLGYISKSQVQRVENGLAADLAIPAPNLAASLDCRVALMRLKNAPLGLVYNQEVFLGPVLKKTLELAVSSLTREIESAQIRFITRLREQEQLLSQFQEAKLNHELEAQQWYRLWKQSHHAQCLFSFQGNLVEVNDQAGLLFPLEALKKICQIIAESDYVLLQNNLRRAVGEEVCFSCKLKPVFLPWQGELRILQLPQKLLVNLIFFQDTKKEFSGALEYQNASRIVLKQLNQELQTLISPLKALTANLYTIPNNLPEHKINRELLMQMKEIEVRLSSLSQMSKCALEQSLEK